MLCSSELSNSAQSASETVHSVSGYDARPQTVVDPSVMAMKAAPVFDPRALLAKVGDGRTISKYRKNQIVFSQGEPADAVFYIQKGKIKITVVSEQGKEAVVAILGVDEFFGEGCLAG